jgi:hypothetical protein
MGGVLFGFDQQVWRNAPPPEELVHHARPDGPVAAADGSTLEIRMPDDPAEEVGAPVADDEREGGGEGGDPEGPR